MKGKANLQYFYMTWKRSLRRIPTMLVMGVVLLGVMGGILIGAKKLLYGGQLYKRQEVAVVLEDGNRLMKLAVQFIRQMDSVSTACRFRMMGREEALQSLGSGEVIAALVVPENVFDGIMDGSNVPVQVYLPENSTFESLVFEELLKAGASLLTTAQAEIYAVYDVAVEADALENLNGYQDEIDEWNLELALNREKSFRTEEVSVLGQVSLPAFYGASAGILFCLLCGIGSTFLRLDCSTATGQQLRRAGVGCLGQHLALLLVQTGWLFVLEVFFYQAAIRLLTGWMGERRTVSVGLSVEFFALELLSAAVIAAFHLLVYTAFQEQTGTTVFLALASAGMLLLSGGFIPAAFLPLGFRRAARCLPSTWLLQMQSRLLESGTVRDGGRVALVLSVFLVGFAGIGVLLRWRQLRR